jgi:hypothetical protein
MHHLHDRVRLRPLVQCRCLVGQSAHVMDGGGNQAPPRVDRLKHVSQIEARSRVTVPASLRGVDGMKLQKESASRTFAVEGVGEL